jgi:hypothetical protein
VLNGDDIDAASYPFLNISPEKQSELIKYLQEKYGDQFQQSYKERLELLFTRKDNEAHLFAFYTFAGLDNLFKASESPVAPVSELGMFGVSAASISSASSSDAAEICDSPRY